MKHTCTTVLLALCMLLCACEKEIAAEESKQEQQIIPLDNGLKVSALTVAEAINVEAGTQVCIKAYIVASTQRSMSNCDYTAPFEGSSAIVLADKPVGQSDTDNGVDSQLMPVCLTDRKKAREALNLTDNPQNWNHLIYIYGTRERYMSTDGLKKVESFEIVP